ncbi:hypothetical protein SRHO_G00186810 [Serrasalmus rhombeus]
MMMMPVFAGAPWLPKFSGDRGDLKYAEWKEQMLGLLGAAQYTDAQQASIIMGTLVGDAKREVNVLEAGDRDRAVKIFRFLDTLYGDQVALPVLRSRFFSCRQRPEESLRSFMLRLKELSCRLQARDPDEAPSDGQLRDQLLLGMGNGSLRQALKTYVRRNPDEPFAAVCEEAMLMEGEQQGLDPVGVVSYTQGGCCSAKSYSMRDDWKQTLEQEILSEMKEQMKGWTQELLKELQPVVYPPAPQLPPVANPIASRQRVRPCLDRWDPEGRPICRQCNQAGHFARNCRDIAGPSRQGIKVPALSEVVVWGRARMGPRGTDYCGLVEAMPGSHPIEVARVVAVVRRGRVPVRIRNLTPCALTIGRYQKLGCLFRIGEADVFGASELNLTPEADGQVTVSVVEVGASATEGESCPAVNDLGDRRDLTPQQQGELQALLRKWNQVFAVDDEDFGRTDTVQHRILTGDSVPIRERFRPLPPAMYKEMRILLAEMLEKKVIRESVSPWAAPIVMVKKKDGSWRFCVDYRKLNAVTHKDAFPLPRIEETLTTLTQSKWFSTLDLASGYWQVGMDPRDREKTAFSTPLGLYEFERMPFGLCNAPATFQRLMQHCLSGQLSESVLVYLDDIIVYSPDFSSHLQQLDEVLARLWKHGLKLRPDKCKLLQTEVRFLGHVVDGRGVRPDPDKVSAVQQYTVPSTVRQVRAFLGLAGYYRRFIPGFSKIAAPLNRLLCGVPASRARTRRVEWTQECQEAFEALKAVLTQAPILAYADFSLPFVVYTDASNQGLGAVLAQVQDGRERVIAYASRSLHPSEQNDSNYSSFKLELLALKWAVTEKFKDYLMGARFTVFTDNNPVAHLQTARLGATEQRWVAQLSAFNFEVKYRAGKENVNADALSRLVRGPTVVEQVEVESAEGIIARQAGERLDEGHEEWVKVQRSDPEVSEVIAAVRIGNLPGYAERRTLSLGARRLLREFGKLTLHNGVLCRRVIDSNTHEDRLQVLSHS